MPAPDAPCRRYDQFLPRTEAAMLQPSGCDRISPELAGLRSTLADNGIGFSNNIRPKYTYDVAGHRNVTPSQVYIGQDPTYELEMDAKFTYDLTRIGMGGNAQLVVGVTASMSNYPEQIPRYTAFDTLAINQRFFDGQLELQYGYYNLIREYYGMVLGGNASSAALGPVSVIPVQLGLTLFTPSPAFTVAVKDPSLTWYNRFTVARAASGPHGTTSGFQWDIDHSPSGLAFSVPGAKALLVNEFGYKTPLGAPGRETWARAGVIYNTSEVTRYDQAPGARAPDNYGGYLAFTTQLTQPDGMGPRGLHVDMKVDFAPKDRNLFSRGYQMTAYYLGPFANRPMDMVSFGYSYSKFSETVRSSLGAIGVSSANYSSAITLSYAAMLSPGIAWINGITYQKNPTFTPLLPNAVIFQSALNFSF